MQPKTYEDERCQMGAESPKPGVLCSVVSGYATMRCVEMLMKAFDEVARESPGERIDAFHDWEGVRGYAAGVMERYTEWSKLHRDRVHKIHVLVSSRMVAMAISVARLALPYLVGFSDRTEFEKVRFHRSGWLGPSRKGHA